MNNFTHPKNLIDKYLDGTIAETERAKLKQHSQQCSLCRDEIKKIDNMQMILNEALAPASVNTAIAREKIQSAVCLIQRKGGERVQFVRTMTRWAAAACVLLAIGIFAGVKFSQNTGSIGSKKAALLPIKIDKLEGTVLVKHTGALVWEELSPSSDVYLGDTFCSTAKSGLTLLPDKKSKITLAANSTLILAEFNGRTELRLAIGALGAELESPHGPFFVSTPEGEIEALGTIFTVSVE